ARAVGSPQARRTQRVHAQALHHAGPEGVRGNPQTLPRRRRFQAYRRPLYRRVRAAARGSLARRPRPNAGAHLSHLGDGQGLHHARPRGRPFRLTSARAINTGGRAMSAPALFRGSSSPDERSDIRGTPPKSVAHYGDADMYGGQSEACPRVNPHAGKDTRGHGAKTRLCPPTLDSSYFKNSSFHSPSHFGASASDLIGSTMTCLCASSSVFCVRLEGTRPISPRSFWPSGESTKSANRSAAWGCGAFAATAIACGRPTSGSTTAQSIGPPFALIESALPL